MSLTLHFHPLSSYCHKALVSLYETDVPFTPHLVNLGDAQERETFVKLWPIGKFPVLRDEARGQTVPESSIIIEYLQQHYPGKTKLIPGDAELALPVRESDRFFDLHVHEQMGRIIIDRIRPEGQRDSFGVEDAKRRLNTALSVVDAQMAKRTWATDETFTMADCAAAPTLFYINMVVQPLRQSYPHVAAYLERLKARPSYARVLKEAEPFMHMVPRG
ncbi:MAG TPA: glutathione S-transferase family protein [Pseudolabrys sp.]|nr:glutathione S-transferase family protein [Pseudolabrys sp.]